jgi:hypothetical protein
MDKRPEHPEDVCIVTFSARNYTLSKYSICCTVKQDFTVGIFTGRVESTSIKIKDLYHFTTYTAIEKNLKGSTCHTVMYYWFHEIVGDDDDYWQERLEKVLF